MNRLGWRLADLASRLLDEGERDVVCGDLAEARATGAHALREVLGLVGRRQLLLWTGWRPWLALSTLVVPLGLLLGATAARWAYTEAIYAWLYVDNWTWAYIQSAGSRLELERHVASFAFRIAALASASWASGFVLAVVSRRAIWATGGLFCLALLGAFTAMTPPVAEQHAEVFAVTFYRVVLPPLTATMLILMPSIWGMRLACRL